MLIRNPINPYPQNITIDPNISKIKFTFSGDRLKSYQIRIFNYSETGAEDLIFDSNVINLDDYVYNNEEIELEKTLNEMIAEASGEPLQGKSCTWDIIMSPYEELGLYEDNIEGSPNFTSLRYYFEANYSPYIVSKPDGANHSFLINGEPCYYDNSDPNPVINIDSLENRNLKVEGYCYKGGIKYYYFELYDEDKNLIEKTNKIFSNKVQYSFSGLLSSKNYALHFYATSQKEQYINVIFNINVSYELKNDINYPPVLTCNENEANVKIKWIKDSTSVGIASGEYEIDETNSEVNISTGTIVYDNISSFPISMDKNNFTVGLKTTINEKTTKIFDYINNGVLYEIYMENYTIYLRYGDLALTNKTIKEIGTFVTNIKFGIQDYASPVVDTGYMWYNDENYNVPDPEDKSKYLLISSDLGEKKYIIILQNDNGAVSCTISKLGAKNE